MQHSIQSCITTVSFPKNLESLYAMLEKNDGMLGDLDFFLNFVPGTELYWTAPKWLTEGDILFFYHAVSAKPRISSLIKQAKAVGDHELLEFLHHSKALADKYAGTILGYAVVSEQSMFFHEDNREWHFKGRVFAPLGTVHVFTHPIEAKSFSPILLISRQSALTYITPEQFTEIKRLLSLTNTLPEYLTHAEFTEAGFKTINKANWYTVACAHTTRFALEIQLRSYFLDYFLAELKDPGSSLLEECHCHRDGMNTGFADYFVRLSGRWIPVEAKLNLKTEKDIVSQIAKYIRIDSFTPTKGKSKGERFPVDADNAFCIIADQFGVYLLRDKDFEDCSEDAPIWKRTDISMAAIPDMRKHLKQYLVT